MEQIISENLRFTPLTAEAFPQLRLWLKEPHVQKYWSSPETLEVFEEKYQKLLTSSFKQAFIVSIDGEPAGYVQTYQATAVGNGWWPNEKDTTIGLDFYIGNTRFLGNGYGTKIILFFSNYLLSMPKCLKVIADPAPSNVAAIRCFSKAAFKNQGLITTPDGEAILMAKELA